MDLGAVARMLEHVPGMGPVGPMRVAGVFAAFAVAVLLNAAWAGGPSRARAQAYAFLLSVVPVALVVVRHSLDHLHQSTAPNAACAALGLAWLGAMAVTGLGANVSPATLPRLAVADAQRLVRAPLRVVGLLLLVAVSGTVIWRDWRASTVSVEDFRRWYAAQRRVDVGSSDDETPIVIVRFQDYQCPACRANHVSMGEALHDFDAAHPGAVRLIDRDFPLQHDCNPAVENTLHPAACDAAAAARIGRLLHVDEAFTQWLFENQRALTPQRVWGAFERIAGRRATSAEILAARRRIEEDVALGLALGVSGTPTVFVNGVRISAVPAAFLAAALDYELARQAHPIPQAKSRDTRPIIVRHP
jgi:protein-disulfide isomerase